jgi:tight adherence protein C
MDFLSLSRPLILFLVFTGVAIFVAGVLTFFESHRAVRRRVAEQVQSAATGGTTSLRGALLESAWVKLVNLIEKRGLSLAATKGDQLRKKMIAA